MSLAGRRWNEMMSNCPSMYFVVCQNSTLFKCFAILNLYCAYTVFGLVTNLQQIWSFQEKVRQCKSAHNMPQSRRRQKGRTRIIEILQIVPARQPKIRRKLIPQLVLTRTEKLLGRVRAHAAKPRRKLSSIPHVEGRPDIRDGHPHFADQVVSRCRALLLGRASWAGDDPFVV